MMMLEKLTTETRNQKTMALDTMSVLDILRCMNHEDRNVPRVVSGELIKIEQVVRLAISAFQSGGRLIYMGAGTSGRLGVLDAVECVPTFSASPDKVFGLIAGGKRAITEAVEGVEDSPDMGAQDLMRLSLGKNDLVVGIAASGRTPYVIGGLDYARKVGAATAGLSCNPHSEISRHAGVAIEIDTGPEVLTGSTRLKAGTAQKLVLNMISTASMIGLGKAYENLMVDVQPTNEKLIERSKRIIMEATNVDHPTAEVYFREAHRNVKSAIIMILLQCTFEEASERLKNAQGFIRRAVSADAKSE
jgi:N-acetylmuramic acid 6-phosphate etherase